MATKRKRESSIPDRWLNCPRKSLGLIADKFIAFKTPLSNRYDSEIPPKFRFPPQMLFQSLKSYDIKIGLWIDLTNTDRYYSNEEVEHNGATYVKLSCRGHGEAPGDEQIEGFIRLCKMFIAKQPLHCIGVHCTHGFNRTGYLICCFLVEAWDWSIEAAVREFAMKRDPGIYKPDYLNDLYERCKSKDTPDFPPYPDWSNDVEEDGDSGDESDESSSDMPGHSKKPKKKQGSYKMCSFMEGVSGVHQADFEKTQSIKFKIRAACKCKTMSFPGSQPVSMDLKNINNLEHRPYKVSWKADGIRYMMYIEQQDAVYFADRNEAIFQVENLIFPSKGNLNVHIRNTLLDGEMVMDHIGGKNHPRYLVYDIILLEGFHIGSRSLDERLKCIKDEIIDPRTKAILQGKVDKTREHFSVRAKDFWDIDLTEKLLSDKFAQSLGHERDGLIYQPVDEPYVPLTCPSVLKWKPPELNTIDFRLRIIRENREGMLSKNIGQLYLEGYPNCIGNIKVTKSIKELDNKIIECKWENNEWKFLRVRSDKKYANSYKTAKSVLDSIQFPVTKDYLLSFIKSCKEKFMMPPPRSM